MEPPDSDEMPAPPPARVARGVAAWLAAIVVVGLALRLGLYAAIWANGGNPLLGDEGNYVEAARSLAAGLGIPDAWLWIRPPGFILVAAAVFRLSDDSLQALNLLQIAFSTLSIPLLFVLARLGLERAGYSMGVADRAGLLAAAVLALSPSLILASLFFLSETLFLLLVILLSLLLVLLTSPGARRLPLLAVAAGLTGGAALLVRANSLTFLLPFMLLMLLRLPGGWRRRAALTALFAAGILLVLAPWTIRNFYHYDRFLPLETTGPYNLWLDNNDLGRQEVDAQLWQIENPADRGGVALANAIDWIAAHPGDFASRFVTRLGQSVAPDDFTEAGYPLRDKLPGSTCLGHDAFSFGATVGYLLLAAIGFAGWLAARRGVLWWIAAIYCAAYVLTAGLTHNEFRFRLQLFPLLAIFAALAVVRPQAFFRGDPGGASLPRWLVLAGLAVALGWLALGLPNIGGGVSKALQTAAYVRASAGEGPAALEAAGTAAELNPTCAAAWRRYAVLLGNERRPEEAAEAFEHALRFEPGDYRTRALYAAELRKTDPRAAARLVAEVPPTFNFALQRWAWDNFAGEAEQALDVGADDLGLVRGFYPPEDDPSGFDYRWAAEEAALRVANTAGGASISFRARALALASGAGRRVEVLLNGRQVASLTLDSTWRDYSVALPGELAPGLLELGFRSIASRPSAEDPRRLSIALDMAEVVP